MGITRTDILRVRLEADDDGTLRASLAGVAQSTDAVAQSTSTATTATAASAAAMKTSAAAAGELTAARTALGETEEQAIARIHAMVEASLAADQATYQRTVSEQALAAAQAGTTAATAEQIAATHALIDAQTEQMAAYTAMQAPLRELDALLAQRTLTTADVARAEALLDEAQASGVISAGELSEAFAALDAAKVRDVAATEADTVATVENTAAHINSRTAYSAEALISDAATGQFSRSRREIAALANETGLLSIVLSPLGLAFGAVAAAVGVMIVGEVKGEQQTAALTAAIAASGNAIGATTGQLEGMVQQLGALNNGNYAGAREAIETLAKEGKLAATSFVSIGQAALDMATLTGQSVGAAAKELADLADQPAKAVEQYHLLTVAQYDQITALEKQGQTVTAEALAEHDYAQALKQRALEVQDSAGIIARAGQFIKEAWEGAWNAVDAIGRPSTDAEQLVALQAKASTLQDQLVSGQKQAARTGVNARSGALSTTDFDPAATGQELQQVNAAIAALQTKMIQGSFDSFNSQQSALANSQAVAAQQALDKFKAPDRKLQDDLDQAALNKARALYGVVDPAKRAQIEAEFNQEVTDAHLAYTAALKKNDPGASKAAAAQSALDQYVNGLDAQSLQAASTPLTKYTDGIAKLVSEYDKAIAKGAGVAAATADFDKGQQALARSLDQTTAKLNEQDSAALTAYKDSLDKTNAALQQSVDAQVAKVSMGDKEYALTQQITKAYMDEAAALAQLQQQLENDLANGEDPARAEALYAEKQKALQASTAKQVEIVKNGYVQMDAAQASWQNGAIHAMQNWADQGADVAAQTAQLFTDAFGSMNDALANFVTTGKLNFSDLVRSILSDLAKMELRVIESKILQEIVGAFVGGGVSDSAGVGTSMDTTSGDVAFGTDAVASANGNVFGNAGLLTAFANGGAFSNSIVNKPTLFAFANGTGVMGEDGPEAIMPLTRGPNGKLGVQASGGGSGGGDINVQIITQVDNSGNATTKTSGSQQNQLVKQFGDQMKAVAQQEITRSTQPGGTLWKMRVGQA
jgi:lambda family phage tail tape measure protein